MAGPCLGGACPLSESAVVEYVSGVEGLGCDVVKSWDALRLFPKTMGPQPSQRVSHPPAVDCSPLQKAAMLQRIGFLEVASTPEAVERYNECAGFQGSCTEQLHCLKMRRLIDDDV